MRLRFPIEFAMQSIDRLADSDVAYLAYSLTRQRKELKLTFLLLELSLIRLNLCYLLPGVSFLFPTFE